MLSSAMLPALALIAGVTGTSISGLIYLAVQRDRHRAERDRWRAAERLAERHGIQALTVLPRLAPAMREPTECPQLPRQRCARSGVATLPVNRLRP
jgi:hypothetical protein